MPLNQYLETIVKRLTDLDEQVNLDSLPEVQAMRRVVSLKASFDPDRIATLCVAAALNEYQEFIHSNPVGGSYWGRFVDWAVNEGEGAPPWRRFPNRKRRRFERFRGSSLWNANLLSMDSGQVQFCLAQVMKQSPLQKTNCYPPLVLARWAHVLGREFTVVSEHPVPKDSRISRFLNGFPGIEPHDMIIEANAARRRVGRRDLNMSDFDAWVWQADASVLTQPECQG